MSPQARKNISVVIVEHQKAVTRLSGSSTAFTVIIRVINKSSPRVDKVVERPAPVIAIVTTLL